MNNSIDYRQHGNYAPVSISETSGANAQAPLAESLVSSVENVPVANSKPMIEVTAPATLPEGYEFEVAFGDTQMKVKVPAGGVEQGQQFSVPFPEKLSSGVTGIHIPVGHWRDELFQFLNYGICHPHLWTSWLCTFLAAGQVIRRMQFNWQGLPPDDTSERASAFSIIFAIVCAYFTIHFMLVIIIDTMDPNFGHDDDKDWVKIPDTPSLYLLKLVYMTWSFVYWIGSTIVLINTRRSVRQRYGIPAEDFEDCLCGVFCHCCVVSCLVDVSNLAFKEHSLTPSTISFIQGGATSPTYHRLRCLPQSLLLRYGTSSTWTSNCLEGLYTQSGLYPRYTY